RCLAAEYGDRLASTVQVVEAYALAGRAEDRRHGDPLAHRLPLTRAGHGNGEGAIPALDEFGDVADVLSSLEPGLGNHDWRVAGAQVGGPASKERSQVDVRGWFHRRSELGGAFRLRIALRRRSALVAGC